MSNAPSNESKKSKPTAADLRAAERLRGLWERRESGITQDTVGELLDISQSAVSQYLNGQISLNFLAVNAFAVVLHCDPRDIRDDLPEQRFFSRIGVREPHAAYIVVKEDEKAMLDKYRAAGAHGQKSLQAVGDALAKPSEVTGTDN